MQPQYPYQPSSTTTNYAPMQQPMQVQATFTQPTFVDPAGGGGGSPLKIREIVGRACAVRPTQFIAATPGKMYGGKPETDKALMDILVLDGPVPLQYGESRATDGTGGPPVLQLDQLPALISGVMSSGWEVVKSCKAVLDAGANGVILCRVIRGTQGNNPFLLASLGGPQDPQPQVAQQVRAQLAALWTQQAMGQWTSPQPREINGGPRKPAAQQNSAPVAQYPPQAVPQVQYPNYTPTPAPAGWNPEVWANLSSEDRARFAGQ